MARIRTVKPELLTHEDLFAAEQQTGLPLRIAFVGLFTQCDREGRFKWRPGTLKLGILPFDEVDFSRVLDALVTRGFIRRYRVQENEYGIIPTFLKHQVINNRESASELPCPTEGEYFPWDGHTERRAPHASGTRGLPVEHAPSGEGKGKEGKGTGKEGDSVEQSPTAQVFAYWQKVMDKPRAQLDAKRKKAIDGRIKDGYPAEQLFKAIDGCRRDAFSMGQNDRNTPYNDIELICRDGTKVDRFIAIAERGGSFAGHNMHVNHLDHSSSRKAMEESMRKHGISEIPEGEIEL